MSEQKQLEERKEKESTRKWLVFNREIQACDVKNCDCMAIHENPIEDARTGEIYFILNLCSSHHECLTSFDLERAIRMNNDKEYILDCLDTYLKEKEEGIKEDVR